MKSITALLLNKLYQYSEDRKKLIEKIDSLNCQLEVERDANDHLRSRYESLGSGLDKLFRTSFSQCERDNHIMIVSCRIDTKGLTKEVAEHVSVRVAKRLAANIFKRITEKL